MDIVYRYADVELLYAKVLNELNGPTAEAYSFLNDFRTVIINVF
ncbi:RagB/SusD family nutrient uptake outer membrane protein [Sphingobacterium sp. CZ-2]|nr:RagB/SusD family nutrient uptake outer membrane protein [Sphingobacterium sp. CZ-2]